MKLNRRNTLIGLGTIVAGGGAALGTGAFSTVEADRTVDVSTAGDNEALLGLEILSDTLEGEDGDTIEFELGNLNLNGQTEFDGAFEITNSGEDSITVTIEDEDSEDLLAGEAGDSTGIYFVDDDVDDGELDVGEDDSATLDVIFFVTETETDDVGEFDDITIRAEAED